MKYNLHRNIFSNKTFYIVDDRDYILYIISRMHGLKRYQENITAGSSRPFVKPLDLYYLLSLNIPLEYKNDFQLILKELVG